MSPNGSLIEEDHLSEVKDQNIEDQGRISDLFNQGKVPVFLISSVSLTMKTKYSNLIERLGGKCGSPQQSTHLILKQLTRNEKFLCSLASGKWILHTSYLDECEKADKFIEVICILHHRVSSRPLHFAILGRQVRIRKSSFTASSD